MNTEDIYCDSWEHFEILVAAELHESDTLLRNGNVRCEVIFRGHADANWRLQTTLERYLQRLGREHLNYRQDEYHRILRISIAYISSFTDQRFKLSEYEHPNIGPPESNELMIYLRHHGFPSPLLDWTASPYVAAYFAFSESVADDVSIYSFREYCNDGKSVCLNSPHVRGYGPTVKAHKRHHLQQAEYTVCERFELCENERVWYYCNHEDAEFGAFGTQDVLRKYVIPSTERSMVMRKLNLMNINAFSLFANEDGLARTLAFRFLERA